MKRILIAFLFLSLSNIVFSQTYETTWKSIDSRPIPEWFQNAKFGIFIHWGVYSVPAWRKLEPGLYASYAEWYYARVMYNDTNGGRQFHNTNYGEDFEYRDFGPLFKAELFDAEQWAKLFKRSGAKYVVLTTKHHDGFCLWPTKSPYKKDWNSMDIGPNRDLVGELTSAVKTSGLRMGLYYSIIEWESSKTHRTESGYFIPNEIVNKYKIPENEYVDQHLIPQLKELVNNYEPSLIFSDGGEWDGTEEYWKTKEFLSWLYNESSVKNDVVVNDRFAKNMPGNHGDYFSSEYKDTDAIGSNHPWEESRGIGGSYGFNRAENIDDYNSSEELVHELIDIVSRGGNLLLNVGPTSDGRIPVIMQQRLIDIGDWLKINGAAIYGTTSWSGADAAIQKDVFYTQKGNNLFVICTKFPEKPVTVKGVNSAKVSLLGFDGKVSAKAKSKGLTITPPVVTPANNLCNYAWVFKVEGVK